MKWTCKGHEYDSFYQHLNEKRAFYLFGAGHDGKTACDIIQRRYPVPVKGFVDNDPLKQGREYLGWPVYAWKDLCLEDAGVVVTIASSLSRDLDAGLERMGLRKNRDFFHYEEFLSVLAAYRYKELYLPSVSFLPTDRCNLRCRACLNFTPYIKRFQERPWEEVKADLDLFFANVDFIGLFHISGGEPMLCSYIGKLVRYLSEHYGKQIYSLETVTNGTVLPGQEFLDALRDCDIKITVDDYREVLPEHHETFEKAVASLERAGGKEKVIVRKYDSWIDLAPFSAEPDKLGPAALVQKYDACHVPWQEYRDGRLSICNYASFAANAGIIPELREEEYFSLAGYDRSHLKELMEFRLGFSGKGYSEFCRRCAGFLEINPNIVRPAEQLETEARI